MTPDDAGHERPGRSIALIHYTAPPIVGGVEQVVAQQAMLLADAGHDVRLIVGRGGQVDRRVRLVEIPLLDTRHPVIVRLQQALDGGDVPSDFSTVSEAIAAELDAALAGVDLVLAHNVCSLGLNLALTAALRSIADRPAGPRLVLWHHDLAWTSPAYLPRLHAGRPWDLLSSAWPEAEQVVVSEARRLELAALAAIEPQAISVIPNGIDISAMWKLEPETIGLLDRTGLDGASPVLLVPSRITARKNIELSLRVLAEIRRTGRPAALIVTGPVDPHQPHDRTYVESLMDLRRTLGLEDASWFLSEILAASPTDAMMHDLYRLADVLFLPSRDEGFGLPILEAAASRLPIVCTDLPSLRDLAGNAALYIGPDDDPRDVAARMLARIDADPVGLLAREIRTRYAWETIYRDRIAPLLEPA